MDKIKFHYIKSPSHQEVGVDGAIGSVNATGQKIAVSVYTERNAIPRVIVHELSDDGKLGEELREEREGRDGLVRVIHSTFHMDLEQAESVHRWLGERIAELRTIREG